MRILVKEQAFTNEDIYLDGHSWDDCTFRDCNIIMERGDFDCINCLFEHCRLSARGGVVAILKIAKLFYPQIPLIESEESLNRRLFE